MAMLVFGPAEDASVEQLGRCLSVSGGESRGVLCADPCHLVFGHVLNFRRSNPYVREDAERYRERIRNFG